MSTVRGTAEEQIEWWDTQLAGYKTAITGLEETVSTLERAVDSKMFRIAELEKNLSDSNWQNHALVIANEKLVKVAEAAASITLGDLFNSEATPLKQALCAAGYLKEQMK